jgi:hypothetical protein
MWMGSVRDDVCGLAMSLMTNISLNFRYRNRFGRADSRLN